MSVVALEGIVDHGQIRLQPGVSLPDNTRVYVIVPQLQGNDIEHTHMHTPHLIHSEQAADFTLEVLSELQVM